jgi:hypothetical protein
VRDPISKDIIISSKFLVKLPEKKWEINRRRQNRRVIGIA